MGRKPPGGWILPKTVLASQGKTAKRPRGEKVAMPFSPHEVTLPGADVWAERIMSLWPWAAHLPIQGYVPLLLALILLPGEEPCLV